MEFFYYGIGILLTGGLLSIILPERFKSVCTACAALISSVFILIIAWRVLFSGVTISTVVFLTEQIGNVSIVIDRLAAFFIAVISIISSVCSIYAIGYMKHYLSAKRTMGSHFFFLSLLIASMLIVVTVQNAIAFLITWEIMSLSSFFLVVFENEKEEVFKAGINYLIAMHIGVLFLISAFIILIINSGSLDFASFQEVFRNQKLINPLFLLFFAGFGTKAGFMPFHTWLPHAHPAAPSHISGLMSGVIIKTGIYGIVRIITLIPEPTAFMGFFILFISLFSATIGVAYAIAQHNLKKLLAYHSVENIGIIGIGIGTGVLGIIYKIPMLSILGFSGGILHILNHSIFKSMLFYSAGGVYQAVHSLEIEKLGGLFKSMKWTAVFFMIGSIAISGLPPLNGFISEFFIYWGMAAGLQSASLPVAISLIVSIAGLSLIGAMALLCFTKAFNVVFLGCPRSEYREAPVEISWSMKTAMIVLCIFIMTIGLAPAYVFRIISGLAADLAGASPLPDTNVITGTLNSLTIGLFGFICISVVVFGIRSLLLRKKVALFKTWDCGYQAGNARMQYTASSYASTFLNLIRPVLHLKEHITAPSGPFPKEADYESHSEDKIESLAIKPALIIIERILNLFKRIQSGNIQAYILYGLVFLIIISLWMIGV